MAGPSSREGSRWKRRDIDPLNVALKLWQLNLQAADPEGIKNSLRGFGITMMSSRVIRLFRRRAESARNG
jgi:hypothetical protein